MILQSHYLANTVTINVHGGRKSNLTKHITSVHEGEKPDITSVHERNTGFEC